MTDLILSVLEDLVIGLFVLLHCLFELDGVDLDAEELRREVSIEAKHVSVLHLPALPQQNTDTLLEALCENCPVHTSHAPSLRLCNTLHLPLGCRDHINTIVSMHHIEISKSILRPPVYFHYMLCLPL